MSILKKAAAAALCAAVLTACIPSVYAYAAPCENAAGICVSQASQSKKVELKTAANTFGKITVSIKTDKKAAGVLVQFEYADTGLTFVPSKSKALIKAADGKYPNPVISGERFSVLFPPTGSDCSKGTEIAELVFSGSPKAAANGAVTFTAIEIYDPDYNELGIDALVFKAESSAESAHVHNVVIDAAVEATCTHTGRTEGSHCSSCGEILKAQLMIPMKAHSYSNGVCTVCGKKDPNYKPPVSEKGIYGDVNGDTAITSEDALIVLRATVGLTALEGTAKTAADVDGSGDLTSSDALEILRHSLGIGSPTARTGKQF